jgi:hypothetical protein
VGLGGAEGRVRMSRGRRKGWNRERATRASRASSFGLASHGDHAGFFFSGERQWEGSAAVLLRVSVA